MCTLGQCRIALTIGFTPPDVYSTPNSKDTPRWTNDTSFLLPNTLPFVNSLSIVLGGYLRQTTLNILAKVPVLFGGITSLKINRSSLTLADVATVASLLPSLEHLGLKDGSAYRGASDETEPEHIPLPPLTLRQCSLLVGRSYQAILLPWLANSPNHPPQLTSLTIRACSACSCDNCRSIYGDFDIDDFLPWFSGSLVNLRIVQLDSNWEFDSILKPKVPWGDFTALWSFEVLSLRNVCTPDFLRMLSALSGLSLESIHLHIIQSDDIIDSIDDWKALDDSFKLPNFSSLTNLTLILDGYSSPEEDHAQYFSVCTTRGILTRIYNHRDWHDAYLELCA
ncbi:hypothetical protein HGRIS_012067 [Hohenbuehelia grisea]